MKYVLIFLAVTLGLLLIGSSQSYAMDYYENNNFKLSGSPNICGVEPDLNYISSMMAYNINNRNDEAKKASALMISELQDSVNQWKGKLNQANGKNQPWKINLIDVKSKNDIINIRCDILVNFLGYPDYNKGNYTYVGGVTSYDYSSHKAYVNIYYFVVGYKNGAGLNAIITHELGHAFGLGHYITSSDEAKAWEIMNGSPPSIMVPSESKIPNHYGITDLDVSQIKLKYGNNGFGDMQQKPIVNIIKVMLIDPHFLIEQNAIYNYLNSHLFIVDLGGS